MKTLFIPFGLVILLTPTITINVESKRTPSNGLTPQTSSLPPAKEVLIAEKDPGARLIDKESLLCLPGPKIAWRTKRNEKWSLMVNGQEQATGFDDLKLYDFSEDCKYVFYAGRRAKKWVVMRNSEQLGAESDDMPQGRITNDGLQWAFLFRRGKKAIIVNTGKESAEYDEIGTPEFNRDGKHLLYLIRRGKKEVLVLDEKEVSTELDDVQGWTFMGETDRFAFVGRVGGDCFVYMDGKPGPPYNVIGALSFNKDGSRFAYSAAKFGKGYKATGQVIVDGKIGPGFPGGIGGFTVGMLREQGVDPTLGYFNYLLEEYHGVSGVITSGETWHIAYISRREKAERIVMVDDQPGPTFERILGDPAFSADGQHFGYVGKDKGGFSFVRGTVGPDAKFVATALPAPISFSYAEQLTFSPDNRQFAFVSVKEGAWKGATIRAHRRVWLDGQSGRDYDALGLSGLTFTPDGKHLAYIVHDPGNNKHFIVVDGREGKHYEEIYFSLRYAGPEGFTFVAREGRKYLLVTQSIQ